MNHIYVGTDNETEKYTTESIYQFLNQLRNLILLQVTESDVAPKDKPVKKKTQSTKAFQTIFGSDHFGFNRLILHHQCQLGRLGGDLSTNRHTGTQFVWAHHRLLQCKDTSNNK